MFKVPEYQECKLGDTGPAVKLLQELLTFTGFPVKLDGSFGKATLWALTMARAKLYCVVAADPSKYWESDFNRLVIPFQVRKDTTLSVKQNILRFVTMFLERRFREIGGQNMGPCVRFFCNGNEGAAWAWCAAFVTEIVKMSGGLISKIYNCTDLHQFAKENSLLVTVPQEGYIFLVPRTDGTFSHTGLISKVSEDGSCFMTIEGNSNGEFDPEGREVTSLIRATASYKFVKTWES